MKSKKLWSFVMVVILMMTMLYGCGAKSNTSTEDTATTDKGYIMENSLGVGAAQGIQKFIDGEAAMTFDGTFNATALTATGAAGDFERGFFALPGNVAVDPVYTAGASSGGPAIYADTKYPAEWKAILEYWFDGASPLYEAWASTGKVIPTYGFIVGNPLFDNCMELYQDGKSFYWCNQGWPAGTENEMMAKFSEMIGGMGTRRGSTSEEVFTYCDHVKGKWSI